jgi:hypothetical protein
VSLCTMETVALPNIQRELPLLSDVKDALDNMNAINQYYVHMHLLVL